MGPLKALQRGAGALLGLACAGAGLAADIREARYDARTDTLLVEIAYRGTNAKHDFSVEWAACEDGRTVGRLIDSQWRDEAREPYRVRERVSLAAIPCRPAQVTLRLGRTSHLQVHVPERRRE